ncbi:oligosaccharide reducing-end xylanase [Paenibacillus endophyticus]|uniref:Oligosaccharide reducing-end xylanase n=1 Tax=Paenibacillus endophyticus TaxID=1294268 RepID=A0A7W5C9V1_9BACL|nr:glycosyl hydrolase family 8 [Paenibacillus endophyticus]MBB3153770.1 oligosaccharide reducing-end xylanase [Paenibacillus endophyticus]
MMKALGTGAYYTGKYRNLFEQFGYHNEEIEKRVKDTWDKLFEGDDDTRIYYEAGENMGYLLDTGNLDVRTEGMSYGMMMAVQMGRKDIFDRIWSWTMSYMYMENGENAGYFAWSCEIDGTKRSNGPAPDGEEYFALALFFASHRWGDGLAPFDYSVQARNLLHACVHKGENNDGFPMWEPSNHLIKFIPNCDFSDPSYHLPHFYDLFALWANPEDREFWGKAAEASRSYLQLSCHQATGLAPEYAYYDGTPNNERGYGHFFSDSYRVAANIGLDTEWFGVDEWQREEANRIQAFFADISPSDYRRYTIAGEPFEEKSLHPVGLLATNAMASLASADGPNAKVMVDLLWQTPLRTGERRYYDNCLYLFAMLALSGNFRIWMPN